MLAKQAGSTSARSVYSEHCNGSPSGLLRQSLTRPKMCFPRAMSGLAIRSFSVRSKLDMVLDV